MKLSKNIFSKNIFFIIFLIIFLIIVLLYYTKYYSKNEEHYSNGLLDLLEYKGDPIKYNIDKNNKTENQEEEEEKIIYKHIYRK